jgi:hypothetical protein
VPGPGHGHLLHAVPEIEGTAVSEIEGTAVSEIYGTAGSEIQGKAVSDLRLDLDMGICYMRFPRSKAGLRSAVSEGTTKWVFPQFCFLNQMG